MSIVTVLSTPRGKKRAEDSNGYNYHINRTTEHCCQIPSGLLDQFSQKNSAAGEKIRPQAGHPPNHQKKCCKKCLLQIFGPS